MLHTLSLVEAPSAPNIEHLLPINSTSVEIIWMMDHDRDVVDYVTIEYIYKGPCKCHDQEMCRFNIMENSTANFSIISNLQDYSTYLFKITAYSQAGPSASSEMNITTLPAGK